MKPVFTSDFLAGIEKIQEARHARKLVILAGAGVSAESGVPAWSELIREMRRNADIPAAENDYLKIAQMYYNQRQSKEYYDTIRRILKYRKAVPNRNHRAVFDLTPEHVITTNYEDLFEQVVNQEALAYSFVRRDQELPTAANTNLVIKMHGDLEVQNIVLKEDDYINYERDFPLINNYIGGLFASRLVLFVGFSFSDWNLKLILQQVRNVLSSNAQPAYMLTGASLSPSEIQYFRERGVVPLMYTPAIESYLRLHQKYKEANELTPRGRTLFNFLTFIRSYDAFQDRYDQAHVLDQMYYSLRRFDELPFLAPHSLPDYYPFKKLLAFQRYKLTTNKNGEDQTHPVGTFIETIARENQVTLPLHKDQIKRAKLGVVDDYEAKLRYVINRLNDCYIAWINDVDIYLDHSNHVNCQCPRCAYLKLDFGSLLKTTYTQPASSPIGKSLQDELMNALANCKIGRFKEAYYLFQDIAKRAWRMDKFLIYAICLVNIQRISRHWDFRLALGFEVAEEIEAIDLSKVANQLTVEPIIQKQITEIIDNSFFDGLSVDIKTTIQKIKETHRHYENNGKQWGGNAEYATLQWYLLQLYSQYNENYIYYEEFSDFEEIVALSLDGLLTAYCTSPDYHYRLETVHSIFLVIAILHCDPEQFRDTFNKHDLPTIKIAEGQPDEADRHLVATAVHFFNSVKGKYGGSNSQFIAATETGHFFKEKVSKVFSNLLTTLAVVELTAEQLARIIPAFIEFIEHQRFLQNQYGAKAALALFIDRRIEAFSREQAENLLDIVLSETSRVERFNVELCVAMYRMNYTIENRVLLDRIVFLYETDRRRLRSDSLFYLYSLVDAEYQQKFRQLLEKKLQTRFDPSTYINAVEFEIIPIEPLYDTFIEQMVNTAEHIKEKQAKAATNATAEMVEAMQTWDGRNELTLLFCNVGKYNLNIEDSRLRQIAEVSPYYQWLLTHQEFDYSTFNPEWFENDPTAYFLKHMKTNRQVKALLRNYIRNHKSARRVQKLTKLYFDFFDADGISE